MPSRPWITPQDVKTYTDFQEVKDRDNAKLLTDISRAETYVLSYTNNKDLLDPTKYPNVPDEIKNAVLLLANAYAHNAVEKTRTLKSETFDDYSYTSESTVIDTSSLLEEIAPLLEEYKVAKAQNMLNMRLRRL